jgi:hypothetical protein
MIRRSIFSGFSEWWYYARVLTEHQRSVLFDHLDKKEKEFLQESYSKDGWEDVFCRNEIESLLDNLKEKYQYDIMDIRSKVLKGKSVYVPTKFWEVLQEGLNQYKPDSVRYITVGMKAIHCKVNKDVVLLVSEASDRSEIVD